MADGDDRPEESENNQCDDLSVPQIGNLQLGEEEEAGALEEVFTEYLALDTQLNQLDACLDKLEARNDDLVTKMKAFVQASQAQTAPQDAGTEDGGDDSGKEPGKDNSDTSGTGVQSCNS